MSNFADVSLAVYIMYVTGTGTVCMSLVLVQYVRMSLVLVQFVGHWYWYSMYVTGTGTLCMSLLLVQSLW